MLVEPEVPFAVQWTTPEASDVSAEQSADNAEQPAKQTEPVPETTWVKMRIVCKGDQIEIFLNDQLTIRYTETDPEIPRSGMIGLQIHSGPPAEAWYRKIRILAL
jgi:hypothetical protein